jgi:hypothetical protein
VTAHTGAVPLPRPPCANTRTLPPLITAFSLAYCVTRFILSGPHVHTRWRDPACVHPPQGGGQCIGANVAWSLHSPPLWLHNSAHQCRISVLARADATSDRLFVTVGFGHCFTSCTCGHCMAKGGVKRVTKCQLQRSSARPWAAKVVASGCSVHAARSADSVWPVVRVGVTRRNTDANNPSRHVLCIHNILHGGVCISFTQSCAG